MSALRHRLSYQCEILYILVSADLAIHCWGSLLSLCFPTRMRGSFQWYVSAGSWGTCPAVYSRLEWNSDIPSRMAGAPSAEPLTKPWFNAST
jgi:hypothetical protein